MKFLGIQINNYQLSLHFKMLNTDCLFIKKIQIEKLYYTEKFVVKNYYDMEFLHILNIKKII